MFSASNTASRTLLAGIAALGALTAASVAHAQAVVVRSTGPSAAVYPQGKKLPANAKVTLRAGDRLTVLDKAGTRVLAGPGSFTLDSSVSRDQAGASRVAGIVSGGGQQRTRTGAVRGASTAPASPAPAGSGPDSVWYLDVSRGGSFCVGDPAAVVLWRPNRVEAATGKLASADGKTADVAWKRGNPLKLWPAAQLPLVDGGSYTFADPVGPTVSITLHLLGAVPTDEVAVAEALAEKGCLAQLDVFANAAVETAQSGGG